MDTHCGRTRGRRTLCRLPATGPRHRRRARPLPGRRGGDTLAGAGRGPLLRGILCAEDAQPAVRFLHGAPGAGRLGRSPADENAAEPPRPVPQRGATAVGAGL